MQAITGNLAVVSRFRKERKNHQADHSFQELSFALQTTLDIAQQLEIFSTHLQHVIPHDGYIFQGDISIDSGSQERHSCLYTLKIENEILGDLSFLRAKPFSEHDLAILEAFLCRLIYPLRNSCRYRRAIQSAHTDALTGINNRTALMSSLQHEWEVAQRYDSKLSVIMLDIDHFKCINDSYGHAQGDAVLRMVAASLEDTVRSSDIAFRYGGEEFVVILSNTSKEGALLLAERIRIELEKQVCRLDDEHSLQVTASFGIATLQVDESVDNLLNRADIAMYQAKKAGRNRVVAAVG